MRTETLSNAGTLGARPRRAARAFWLVVTALLPAAPALRASHGDEMDPAVAVEDPADGTPGPGGSPAATPAAAPPGAAPPAAAPPGAPAAGKSAAPSEAAPVTTPLAPPSTGLSPAEPLVALSTESVRVATASAPAPPMPPLFGVGEPAGAPSAAEAVSASPTPAGPPSAGPPEGSIALPGSGRIPHPPPGAAGRPAKGFPRSRAKPAEPEDAKLPPLVLPPGVLPMRAVHLTAWVAGAPHGRHAFLDAAKGTWLNAVVVPLKETDGRVYIPGVAKAQAWGTAHAAIPDPEALVRDIHAGGLQAVARVVVFKDNFLARRKPEWAVRRPDGRVWANRKGVAWVDPYRREIWEYNLDLAQRAAELGFDEIQFDYVRFPSDGDTSQCRYSHPEHGPRSAVRNLREFLEYARGRLKPYPVRVAAAVFGMTTTASDDMGIGQDLHSIAARVDRICPMMYPSHYAKGEYGLPNPNREPYKVIFRGLRDARGRLGAEAYKLVPYLQDFSLGWRYGPNEVRAQIQAAQAQGIESWILWNPANRYTWGTLRATPDSPLRF